MGFHGNIFSFMPVFTLEHVALILVFLALFRPLCSPCLHICVCVFGEKEDGERERGRGAHACLCVCVCARARVYVLTQPSRYNLITTIRRLKKEKSDFNQEQI
jgi:hypothetical protein